MLEIFFGERFSANNEFYVFFLLHETKGDLGYYFMVLFCLFVCLFGA